MADNVAITAGSGTTVATDEVTISATAVQVQLVKILDATADGTNRLIIDSSGRAQIKKATASTGAKSNWTVTATSGTVLASNTARLGAVFTNDGAATVYLDLTGGTASATSYSVALPANGYYELPTFSVIYTGAITGIGSSATGTVRVTEW